MSIIVQKYGGSSLADPDRVRRCAARAVAARREGRDVVVVASAMGRTTDRLLAAAGAAAREDRAGCRELDALLATGEAASAAMMAMTIRALGVDAVSLTADRLGIRTDGVHGRARIESVDPTTILEQVRQGRIVVAAGWQGIGPDGAVTTFGRGGSDITAAALAGALGVTVTSGQCDIYTDVDGIHTADPNLVAEARRIDRVSWATMQILAWQGVHALHPRAVALAERCAVPMRVLSSLDNGPGTLVAGDDDPGGLYVGCSIEPDIVRAQVRTSEAQSLLQRLGAENVHVDDVSTDDGTLTCTLAGTDRARGLAMLEDDAHAMVSMRDGLSKISVILARATESSVVHADLATALRGITVHELIEGPQRVSVFVARDDATPVVRELHAMIMEARSPERAAVSPA